MVCASLTRLLLVVGMVNADMLGYYMSVGTAAVFVSYL
jgi:hypothetical protein